MALVSVEGATNEKSSEAVARVQVAVVVRGPLRPFLVFVRMT